MISGVQLFMTPWTAARQASLSITNSRSPHKPMSIVSVMPSNHLILSSTSLPALNLSQHQGLSNESALCIRWPNYWEFQLQHQSSNEHPGGISFRMDWLDLFAVQETLKSLLQHFSSKASFFGAQIFFISKSHIHMWLLENHSFDRWTFIGKIMSLLFNMLSRLVIGFLSRSKCLLISWLQSPSAVIWRPPK